MFAKSAFPLSAKLNADWPVTLAESKSSSSLCAPYTKFLNVAVPFSTNNVLSNVSWLLAVIVHTPLLFADISTTSNKLTLALANTLTPSPITTLAYPVPFAVSVAVVEVTLVIVTPTSAVAMFAASISSHSSLSHYCGVPYLVPVSNHTLLEGFK